MGIGTARSGRANGVAVGPRTLDTPAVPGAIRDGGMARALAVRNYAVAELQSDSAVGGIAQVQIPALAGDLVALVDRIFISTDSAAATTAGVFVGGTATRQQRDFSTNGNKDVADMFSPIYVGRNMPLIVRWEGATDGAVGIAVVQYRICEEVPAATAAVAGLV